MKKAKPKVTEADILLFEEQSGLKGNYSSFENECGCDEAGRGCLAGPVVAAAVILPPDFQCPQLNDSKQLTEQERNLLRPIIEKKALAWAVALVDNREIDDINILNASILAMHRAIDKLNILPDFIIVDGNKFKPYKDIQYQTIIKGDSKYLSIAAASVLAKTHRDEIMQQLHSEFPVYNWDKNKAYPTLKHRSAIRHHGTTPLHRMSYDLLGDKKALVKLQKETKIELKNQQKSIEKSTRKP